MKDIVVVSVVVLAFAWLVTTHIAIIVSLARREPRWRAFAAFVAPPLAPYWAWREHMRARAGLWALGAIAYVVAVLIASR